MVAFDDLNYTTEQIITITTIQLYTYSAIQQYNYIKWQTIIKLKHAIIDVNTA